MDEQIIVRPEPGPLCPISPQHAATPPACPLCGRPFDNGYSPGQSYFGLLGTLASALSPRRAGASTSTASGAPEDEYRRAHDSYYRRFFDEDVELGHGGYARVYRCHHVLGNERLGTFAVKKVPVGDSAAWLSRVVKEVRTLESIRHKNVLSYYHAWVERTKVADFGPEVDTLFILLEYANGGSLAELIGRGRMSAAAVTKLFRDTVEGVAYLHERRILHRDIKPQNILLQRDSSGSVRALVSDFGTSISSQEASRQTDGRSGCTGTDGYMAPELLQRDDHGDFHGVHSEKCDVYALGCVLHEMVFGDLPSAGIPLPGPRAEVYADLPWVRNCLALCLASDPAHRPSSAQLLAIIDAECTACAYEYNVRSERTVGNVPLLCDSPACRRAAKSPAKRAGLALEAPRARPTTAEHLSLSIGKPLLYASHYAAWGAMLLLASDRSHPRGLPFVGALLMVSTARFGPCEFGGAQSPSTPVPLGSRCARSTWFDSLVNSLPRTFLSVCSALSTRSVYMLPLYLFVEITAPYVHEAPGAQLARHARGRRHL